MDNEQLRISSLVKGGMRLEQCRGALSMKPVLVIWIDRGMKRGGDASDAVKLAPRATGTITRGKERSSLATVLLKPIRQPCKSCRCRARYQGYGLRRSHR